METSILVADDDASILTALQLLLTVNGFSVTCVTTPVALIEQVKRRKFAAALIDLNYQADTTSGKEGLDAIETIKTLDSHLPIIVMTGYSSVDIAVKAMKLGAGDFIEKPWNNERLISIINTQIKLGQTLTQNARLSQEVQHLKTAEIGIEYDDIVAESPAMQQTLRQLKKLAASDMSILLTGENGTGKSMFAEYIHKHSTRAEHSLVSVNMGAITESLFESELFGHVKGAFTDAKSHRIGRFELAENGSIFLDEIANLSMAQQAKLLRVLEESQFEKVGSSQTQQVDVRLISATNADLAQMIEQETFRQDLLYRLNTVTVALPPLRDRLDDIPKLVAQFVRHFAKQYRLPIKQPSNEAIRHLQAHDWPGNIRELRHIIEKAMYLAEGNTLDTEDLSLNSQAISIRKSLQAESFTGKDWQTASLESIEKEVIENRLKAFDFNPVKTADSLGLSRSAYYRRIEKHKLGQ